MPLIIPKIVLALTIILPIAFAIFVLVADRYSEKLRNGLVVAAVAIEFPLVLMLYWFFLNNDSPIHTYLLHMTPEIWMHLQADPLGIFFGLTVASLWLLATIYSLGYMKGEHAQGRYYCFLLLCLGWIMGLAFGGNLLTFFIFYELFSVTTYPLIIHEQTPEAIAAGKKYIVYILIGGAFVLLGIIYTLFLAGSQTLIKPGILPLTANPQTLKILFWCFIGGFGVKAAIMPLHGWVPDAHPAAPSPFSALLSGVMVAAGVFGIFRVFYNIFGTQLIRKLELGLPLAYVVSFTIVFASVLAIDQNNIKRRLAYSTIGQMGYMFLGISLLSQKAAWGGILHIVNHAFMKGTLFLCAGIIIKQAGIVNVSEMRGLARRFPITMAAFTINALAMMGVPPLSGFITKWFIGLGALYAKQPFFIVILLIGSLLAACYLLPIVYLAYFGKTTAEPEAETSHSSAHSKKKEPSYKIEAPLTMLVPVIIGTLATVSLGLLATTPASPLTLVRVVVRTLLR